MARCAQGHDWGAPVAWHSAQFRPDKFKGVVGLSVPFRPRGDVPPTTTMTETNDAIFYQLYFQRPGVAEPGLEKDVSRSLSTMLLGVAGSANVESASGGMIPKGVFWLDSRIPLDAMPPWITQTDIDCYSNEFKRSGFRGGLNWYRNIDRNWKLLAPWAGAKGDRSSALRCG